ncbi:WD40-repeat-containing domain protein [Xylariaceae sp. FL1272]|nr:WD40-repeat-containing domain protein [Xylariaceae sp. FL1272]
MSSSAPTNEHMNPPTSPPRTRAGKERKEPSITPRKFGRFFQPRSRVPSKLSPAREALLDLGSSAVNRRYQTPAPSSPLKPLSEIDVLQDDDDDIETDSARQNKRRKYHHTPESSPIRPFLLPSSARSLEPCLLSPIDTPSSSSQNTRTSVKKTPHTGGRSSGRRRPGLQSSPLANDTPKQPPSKRLNTLPGRGLAGQLAQRELGALPHSGRSYLSYPAADWRNETADFQSRPDDVHWCASHEGPGNCIPFSTATCHRTGITAIGDEEGRIRLLDSSSNSSEPFSKIHLSFTAHTNAIIDLEFSNDDYLLATASGDQTGQVIDMMTQSPVAYLGQHTASLKQIRFQPGQANSSVLATSSRDGSVQVWDMRYSRPVQDFEHDEGRAPDLRYSAPHPKTGYAVNSFYHAHARTSRQLRSSAPAGPGDTPSRREIPSRSNDVSVTALQFLSTGQEHLLLTACEADASIKLWDIRFIHSSKNKVPTPISATTPPKSHGTWRPFGISSLALGSDGSRLYAVCKDNTVYAYSTAHLILGHAPELSTTNNEPARRRPNAVTQSGLGPLYGFRHPSFHATSFYIKCAVRPARDGRSEMLAVGSNDACAVLFPTNERYFQDELLGQMGSLSLEDSTVATNAVQNPMRRIDSVRRPLFRKSSTTNFSARLKDDIPIIHSGTPLVRGHEREVGSVAWTNEGKLVSVGDDYLIRCWSEQRELAKDLRTGGEGEGRRWGCGWADVGADWDEGDEEEC